MIFCIEITFIVHFFIEIFEVKKKLKVDGKRIKFVGRRKWRLIEPNEKCGMGSNSNIMDLMPNLLN